MERYGCEFPVVVVLFLHQAWRRVIPPSVLCSILNFCAHSQVQTLKRLILNQCQHEFEADKQVVEITDDSSEEDKYTL